MPADTPIIATVTSADGTTEQYLTAAEITLIEEGLAVVYARKAERYCRWTAPQHCQAISNLQAKFKSIEKEPFYV